MVRMELKVNFCYRIIPCLCGSSYSASLLGMLSQSTERIKARNTKRKWGRRYLRCCRSWRRRTLKRRGKLENLVCSFLHYSTKLMKGSCLVSGACRLYGQDYMNQGGCSRRRWGGGCKMMVTRRTMHRGMCTKSGHCWARYHIQLLSKDCK